MGKDFRAAFSNMNKAVRPGAEQPVMHNIEQPAKQPAKKKKMSLAEKRATMHAVQTYLSEEDFKELMLIKLSSKGMNYEEIIREAIRLYIQVKKNES
ncbi:hypothetical protein [Segatella copri]|jgi:predicted DNA binding CopG/RHH family protein|uniref:hypothetical protein n=1 Tax=Segatella copri TaxID=165179 RepID=UPI001C46C2B0|nr:hypothetical protein [Segatella copri]MBW0050340.1 hypothetical protein [Segatella copri]MCW4120170.1 hypothetical protein [Segatella copri]